ncbi:flagellar brake protein [Sideroxydans lithotrophicus]|uniref:Type IV pilus assembly PilZ n=1 Tax=Sideroxydans lithotrophicus (strain ES-1) TaxID=580332 RepID=D5CSE9_SIDLE|nr:flagellar brake protein [Sideroxydans lithotrophicus]ADE11885.1 type IV pilus assembly PilZ [Sideroxydans lithotrophicus ES-1]
MSLILLKPNEVMVGKPAPWPLYDQNYTLLLGRGELVRDEEHLDALLAGGARHELSWEVPDNVEEERFSALEEAATGASGANGAKTSFGFDDLNLKSEDRLQLEPPAQLSHERFTVKVIGFLRGSSLLVSMPITANGLRLQLREKEKVVMRSFSGQNAFGFACTILKICKIPYEYMHLSIPGDIQGIMIRKAPRVRTRIIAAVRGSKSGEAEQISALISDISANGVSLESRSALGGKGDTLNLSFRVQLHNIDAYLSLKGIIRATFTTGQDGTAKPPLVRHGIEFQDLPPNDSVILQSLIYQQLIENPHMLV